MVAKSPFRGEISLPIDDTELKIVVGDGSDVVYFRDVKIDLRKEIIPAHSGSIEFCQCGDSKAVPIVLLPPAGAEIFHTYCVIPYLIAHGYQVIGVNGRGVAGSCGSLEGLTLHHMAADVAKVIELLEVGPVHVVGNALGNRVARCLAQDYPELARSVTLVAAGGIYGPAPDVKDVLGSLCMIGIDGAKEAVALAAIKRSFLSHYAGSVKGTAIGKLLLYYFNRHPDATVAQIKAGETPVDEWWLSGNAPLLVVQGLEDKIAPPSNGEQLKRELLDRVTLVNIPDTGHGLLQERPGEIASKISEYISDSGA